MKLKLNNLGFTIIEVMIFISIAIIIAIPILKFKYATEIHQIEDQFFKSLGISETVRSIALGIAICIFFYFRFKPKKKNHKKQTFTPLGKSIILLGISIITLLVIFVTFNIVT